MQKLALVNLLSADQSSVCCQVQKVHIQCVCVYYTPEYGLDVST